jgi:membrane fusion protein, copper/silver efflux system
MRAPVMFLQRHPRRAAIALTAVVGVAAGALWYVPDARSGDVAGQAAAQVDPHAGHAAPQPDPHADHGTTDSEGTIAISQEMLATLGVGTVAAELAPMQKTIRTTGNVVYDETRLTTVAPKYAGFVERLYVDFTGQPVRRGQPLLEVYSPELVAAQEELLSAIRMQEQLTAGGAATTVIERTAGLVDAARRRLLLWDVSAEQVRQIERSGQVRRTLTLHAPFGGVVTEKMVQAGQAIGMGMPLYRLADLGTVWVEADIYEQDLRMVRIGERVQVQIDAYPGETFTGRASYVYPDVRPDTRTGRMRVELANPGARLKPGMYATVLVDAPLVEHAVFVPRDAVMHSGTHAMVFVEEGPGVFRVREVKVGSDLGGRTQIISGLLAGERVVNRANFLLDSESRLKDAMGAMPGMNH